MVLDARKERRLLGVGVGAASLHLALAALMMAGVNLGAGGKLGKGLSAYAALTVSNGSFSFFAPGIGPGTRVVFRVRSPAGAEETIDYSSALNREIQLRISNQFRVILGHLDDALVRRAVGSSWAAFIFGAFPAAREVAVCLQLWEVPTMGEYRGGARAYWKTVYEAGFSRPL